MKKLIVFALAGYLVYWGATSWVDGLRGMVRWTEPEAHRVLASAGIQMPSLSDTPALFRPSAAAPVFSPTAGSPLSAQLSAEQYLEERKKSWGVQDYHELKATVYESPTGQSVKYQVYQDNLPIVGMEIALEFNPDHSVRTIENGYRPLRRVDLTQPTLSQDEVIKAQGGRYTLDETSTAGVASVLYLPSGSDVPELSYVMPVREADGRSAQLVFRAADGQVLGRQTSRAESFKPR